MPGKLPWMKWFPGEWRKDPSVGMRSLKTRGAWIEAIGAMHELGHCGELIGTVDQLARLCRCSSDEMLAAMIELRETGATDVEGLPESVTGHGIERDETVTDHAEIRIGHVVATSRNRRMHRAAKPPIQARLRQRRRRGSRSGHADDAETLRTPSSSSASAIAADACAPAGAREAAEREASWQQGAASDDQREAGLAALKAQMRPSAPDEPESAPESATEPTAEEVA